MPLRITHLLLISALAHLAASEFAAGATPGLVAEKPAEGPSIKTDQGYMVPYTVQLPGSKVEFQMAPVPGGVVEVSIESEASDEGTPQTIRVELPPYWIAAHEVSWGEYWRYMALDGAFSKLAALRNLASQSDDSAKAVAPVLKKYERLWRAVQSTPSKLDAVTAPTPLYDPTATYESGEEPDLPAVTMTPYAAKQYTKWLSRMTGVGYRLPSEAEWQHAALAGGPAPYGAGAGGAVIDEDSLDDYAWTDSNSDYTAHERGEKKPNAWGLYDMIGNVAELVLDEQRERDAPGGESPVDWKTGVAWPEEAFPRIAKGGWYDAAPSDCVVTSRMPTNDEDWKLSDPNVPKSPWWYADYPATGVGFRIVRPLAPMPDEVKALVWETDHESIQADVETRLKEGRGKAQAVNEELPQVIEQLKESDIRKLLN